MSVWRQKGIHPVETCCSYPNGLRWGPGHNEETQLLVAVLQLRLWESNLILGELRLPSNVILI